MKTVAVILLVILCASFAIPIVVGIAVVWLDMWRTMFEFVSDWRYRRRT